MANTFFEDPNPTLIALFATAVVIGISTIIYALVLSATRRVALQPARWRKFKLVKKTYISPNVVRLKFDLQTPTTVLGLPIGQHISIQGVDEAGAEFTKPYTPISLDKDVGYVEYVIKLYPEGQMSKYLAKAKEGDLIAMRGPKGRFQYKKNMVRHFGMVGGGTGITPMFQVARAILEDPEEKTKITLISANVTEEDILLREEMDKFAKDFPDRFSVHYVLNKPPEGWKGGVGYVSKSMLEEHMPAPSNEIMVLYCGPLPMNKAIKANLEEIGYTQYQMFKF